MSKMEKKSKTLLAIIRGQRAVIAPAQEVPPVVVSEKTGIAQPIRATVAAFTNLKQQIRDCRAEVLAIPA